MKYRDLHFFIDESGRLEAPEGDIALLGGVLLYGTYDRAADDQLYRIFEKRLTEANAACPQDLHEFFTTIRNRQRLSGAQRRVILDGLSQDLPVWAGSERLVYGVSLAHRKDILEHGPAAEKHYDTRYVMMLWRLLEHLVFVDQDVLRHLAPDATLHLHIANRRFLFDAGAILPEELVQLGFGVIPDERRPGHWIVQSVLREGDILTMVRMAHSQRRWPTALRVGKIEVKSLKHYRERAHPAALYLADLYLGRVRREQLDVRRAHSRHSNLPEVLSSFRKLTYGKWLDLLAQMQIALNAGDVDHYLNLAARYDALNENLKDYEPIVLRQEMTAKSLLARAPEKITARLQEACRVVDQPGRAGEGKRQADRALRLLPNDLYAKVLALQARLSFANHIGDVQAAAEYWNEYENIEPQLSTLGYKGFQLKAEVRNRRAVSLTDCFAYKAAEEVLLQVILTQEEHRETMKRDFEATEFPQRELGACYGTLGQLYCLMAMVKNQKDAPKYHQDAEDYFRKAITLFTDPLDRERQWVYLGHLACDQGRDGGPDAGRALWCEVMERLPEAAGNKDPVTREHGQFLLHLQLKGVLVFGDTEQLNTFLGRWEKRKPIKQYRVKSRHQIPFGLIQQAVALNYQRAWRANPGHKNYAQRARDEFQAAFSEVDQIDKNKRGLVRVLDCVSQLRGFIFRREVEPNADPAEQELQRKFLELKGLLMAHFNEYGWSEDESGRAGGIFGECDPGPGPGTPPTPWLERAKGVLKAIRFSYW